MPIEARSDHLIEMAEALGLLHFEVDLVERRIVYASPVLERLGVRAGMAVGRGEFEALVDRFLPDEEGRRQLTELAYGGGARDQGRFVYRARVEGAERWRQWEVRVARSPEGVALRVDILSSDVTEVVEARRAAERAETLRRLTMRVYDADGGREAADAICDEARAAVAADFVSLWLFDDANSTATPFFQRGGPKGVSPVKLDHELLSGWHQRRGGVVHFGDIRAADDLPHREVLLSMGVRSFATAAIGAGVRPLGMINAGRLEERPFEGHELTLLGAIAGAVAAPLARAVFTEERMRAEASVRAAEARRLATQRRYRGIVETMTEGVLLLDDAGRVVLCNPAACAMFGYPEQELLGRPMVELIVPEERAERQREWAERRGAPGPVVREVRRFLAQGGRELWAQVASVPLRDGAGEHGALSILADVTEARRLEQKMQQAQKLESLGVLAGGIAHDFNNLLVGILGNAGLALLDLPRESPARESIENIQTAAQHASELTRQLLAYAGKGRFVIGRIDLRRLVEEMGHLLSTVIGKSAALRYQFGEGVPPVEGDATQLRQVVMNLITNASDAVGEGGGIITLAAERLEIDRAWLAAALLDDELSPGAYVCLTVSDTGAGMDAATRQRIFDPFFTTKFTGRGLGLAAVLGIVRAHRGAIQVQSEPGRGSTFRVLLPAAAGEVARHEPPAASPMARTDGGLVLVVDDEETVRGVVKRVLERAGFEVLTAADGAEGVELFAAHRQRVRAVVLDVTMPRMSGEETFRRLRQLDPSVRVLLASGYSEQEATSQFAGAGLAGFLEKPFRPQRLVEMVREVIAGRGG